MLNSGLKPNVNKTNISLMTLYIREGGIVTATDQTLEFFSAVASEMGQSV